MEFYRLILGFRSVSIANYSDFRYIRSFLCELVGGTLSLRIESGRYCNELRENRICRLCDMNQIGDQFQFLVECPALDNKRKAILASLRRLVDFSGGNPPLVIKNWV